MQLSSIKIDQLTELLRLLPFIIAVLLFLRGQGKRDKRRTTPPAPRPTRATQPPAPKPVAYQIPPPVKSDEPSIWAKDYDKGDQWGLPKEEWGDAFGDKWKSTFDDPAPPKRR